MKTSKYYISNANMNVEKLRKKAQAVAEIDGEFDEEFGICFNKGVEVDKITQDNIKQFISKKLKDQKDYYEKELKAADDRWKANEHWRDEYFNLKNGI